MGNAAFYGRTETETVKTGFAVKGAMMMRQKNRYLRFSLPPARALGMAALFGAALVPAAGLSGCGKEETVIIRETDEETENKENGNAGDPGNPDSGGSSSDSSSQGGTSGTSGTGASLRAQTEAPETYQVHVQTDVLDLTANAPVILPDVSAAPTWALSQSTYEDGQIDKMTDALEQAGVPMDQVLVSRNGQTVLPNASGRSGYQLSIHDGNMEIETIETESETTRSTAAPTPIFWLSCTSTTAASDGNFRSNDLSDFSLSSEEEERLRASLEQKAEDLLASMDLSHMTLQNFQWKRLRSSDPESQDYKLQFRGYYGLQLRYTLSAGGIPAADSRISYFNGSLPASQYVEILYAWDGQLLEFKDIGFNTVGDSLDSEPFLLPFSSIGEIFEQQCRAWHSSDTDSSGPNLRGTVTEVALEYLPQYGDEGDGSLIPVWNFYGSLEFFLSDTSSLYVTVDSSSGENQQILGESQQILEFTDSAEDGQGTRHSTSQNLLLSISALDGQIMGEPDSYYLFSY